MLELDPVLLTGHEMIDTQHRELFARVGALLDASQVGRGRDEVARLLSFLGDYVVTHFAAEEAAMDAALYPNAPGHKTEHAKFVQEFGALYAEFQKEGPGPLFVIRVGNRVTGWLKAHIYRSDRALADWLKTAKH